MEILLRSFQLSVEIASVLLFVQFIFLKAGQRAWNTGKDYLYQLFPEICPCFNPEL